MVTAVVCFLAAVSLTCVVAGSGPGWSIYAGPAVVAWIVTAREVAYAIHR
jgi:hypothetical protein